MSRVAVIPTGVDIHVSQSALFGFQVTSYWLGQLMIIVFWLKALGDGVRYIGIALNKIYWIIYIALTWSLPRYCRV